MNKILVTYATMAGSTGEVAQAIKEEIEKRGFEVQVLPIGEVKDLQPYDGVVVGGPMIMGYHRQALKFLKRNRQMLRQIPFAVFVLAMSLTKSAGEMSAGEIPVYVDDKLPKPPANEAKLNFRERYARLTNYLKPILKSARPALPASIGFFGGRLDYGRLKWWAVLFAMLIIQAPAGERRNWTAIRSWAAGLPAAMGLEETKAEGS